MNVLKRLLDHEYKELKKFRKQAEEIMALDEEYSKLTDTELQNKTAEFKERLQNGERRYPRNCTYCSCCRCL